MSSVEQTSKGGFLIFDLDGTLFQADAVTVPAVQTVFRDAGLPIPSAEKICSFIGKPSDDLRAWIETMCPSREAADLMEMISGKEISLIATRGTLYPGVIEVLAELRRTVNRMALCSNGDREYVDLVLKAHGLERFFDLVRFRRREDTGKTDMVRDVLGQISDRPELITRRMGHPMWPIM
jgi:phosphoglycolate phosphatase